MFNGGQKRYYKCSEVGTLRIASVLEGSKFNIPLLGAGINPIGSIVTELSPKNKNDALGVIVSSHMRMPYPNESRNDTVSYCVLFHAKYCRYSRIELESAFYVHSVKIQIPSSGIVIEPGMGKRERENLKRVMRLADQYSYLSHELPRKQ